MDGNLYCQVTGYGGRMRDCNCAFIIADIGSLIEWITATGITNQLNIFEKRVDSKSLIQRNTVPSKILYHCKWPPKTMMVLLKVIDASASLK